MQGTDKRMCNHAIRTGVSYEGSLVKVLVQHPFYEGCSKRYLPLHLETKNCLRFRTAGLRWIDGLPLLPLALETYYFDH